MRVLTVGAYVVLLAVIALLSRESWGSGRRERRRLVLWFAMQPVAAYAIAGWGALLLPGLPLLGAWVWVSIAGNAQQQYAFGVEGGGAAFIVVWVSGIVLMVPACSCAVTFHRGFPPRPDRPAAR